MPRRRREDTWDDGQPSVPDQALPTSASGVTVQLEPYQELAGNARPNARRRTEDTWDTDGADESDTGAIEIAQDGTAQQTPTAPAESIDTGRILPWDGILLTAHMPTESNHPPRLQAAPQQAASSDPEPPPSSLIHEALSPLPWPEHFPLRQQSAPLEPPTLTPSLSQTDHPTRPRPDPCAQPHRSPSEPEAALLSLSRQAAPPLPQSRALSQPPGPRLGLPHSQWVRPDKAPRIRRNLEQVRIPDCAELATLEQIHGRPGPMSDAIFHQFRRGYGVPPDIAFDMRARSMIGVYPSGLVFLDYERLARIPPQRQRSTGAAIPALYWVRILTVKQAPYREHVEHFLSKTLEPCMCQNCQCDRKQGTVAGPEGHW